MLVDLLFPRSGAPPDDDDFWYTELPASPLATSSNITPESALTTSAVFACIRILAETMALLPLHIMRLDDRNRTKATDLPLYRLLHYQPNSWQTSQEFRMTMMAHLGLRGNAYAWIRPGVFGAVSELIPMNPARTQVFRLPDYRILYVYTDPEGTRWRLTQDEVFHLRSLSTDGVVGLSPVALDRRAIELAQRAEDHGIKYHKNLAKPGGVLQMPAGRTLTKEQHERLRTSWRAAHTAEDLFTVAILEDGTEWQQVGLSNEDAQWLESRRYQVEEIARIWRIPLAFLQNYDKVPYNNAEHQDQSFVKHTILPWCVLWEAAIWRDLITDQETYYAKFAVDGLLRGDTETRGAFYRTLATIGAMSINDIRELEDLNPVDGGDRHFVQLNMVPLDRIDDWIDSKTTATPFGNSPGATEVESVASHLIAGPEQNETVNPDAGFLHAWVMDCSRRIASADIAHLESHAPKASRDRDRFDAWARKLWSGKQREYIRGSLQSLIDAIGKTWIAAEQIADVISQQAISELVNGDPMGVLREWKDTRADRLSAQIKEMIEREMGHD